LGSVTISAPIGGIPAYAAAVANTNISACNLNPGGVKTIYFVAGAAITNGFPGSLKTATDIKGPSSIAATQGTTLSVTFNNLNPGVNYYVPAVITDASGLQLTAVTDATAKTAATVVTTAPAAGNGLVAVSVAAGSGTVFYQVTADTVGAEAATIPLTEYIPSVAGVTSFSPTPVATNITFVSAGTGYPTYSTSQIPYTATQTTSMTGNGLLQACSTTILFPYVVNIAGFDTGLSISNASTLPSNSQVALGPASGTCTLTFYGTGAPAAPGNTFTTPSIPSSGNTAFLLSSTVGASTQGYAVAVCNFQGAHGYAFVIGAGGSADYLGIVLNTNGLTPPAVVF